MKIEIKKEYWKSGEIMGEYSFINGIRNGNQKMYYTNGRKSEEYYMVDNMRHGIRKAWFFERHMVFVQKWKNNQRSGPEITFEYK